MEIERQILDLDGSCRDVNFPDVDRSRAIALFDYVRSFCQLDGALDYEAEGINLESHEIAERLSSSASATIVSYWQCQCLISRIQVFFCWKNDSKILIELTFFPQDIDRDDFSMELFMLWLKPFLVALDVRVFYVRYENAGWKFGDTSAESGVILSHGQYPING